MKKILVPILALCGALLPISQVQAGGPVSKTFGGFAGGKKFTLTVQTVTSSVSIGKKIKSNVAVPQGIPEFSKARKVKFTIGKRGELTAPAAKSKLSIAFVSASGSINSYAKLPDYKSASPNSASIYKDSAGNPNGASLVFYLYRIDANSFSIDNFSINRVVYILK